MANKKTSIVELVLVALLIGFAVWLYTAVAGLSSEITCILDGIKSLSTIDPATQAGQEAASAGAAVPDSVMDPVERAVPLIGVLAILPACMIAIFALILAFCMLSKKEGQSACCTKCLTLLFSLFCFLGIVLYAIIGGVGIVMNGSVGQDAWTTLNEPCTQYDFSADITTADNGIAALAAPPLNYGPGDAPYDQLVAEKAAAETAMAALTGVCTCMSGIFDQLSQFTAPGIACAVVCILIFIVNCCQCCTLFFKKAKVVDSA